MEEVGVSWCKVVWKMPTRARPEQSSEGERRKYVREVERVSGQRK
jgi:hypothetical protein